MKNLFFSSLFTLALLVSFVLGILIYVGEVNLVPAVIITIIMNFVLWLIGPFITDLINGFFYNVKFLSEHDVKEKYPKIHEIIKKVSTQYEFPFPKIGIIADKNPTAFTYGSARFNARIILTQGIFHFLNDEEANAVVAHELGHVVNRDFIIMMVASTLVQILYEIYSWLIRARGKKSGGAKAAALVAYALYYIGIYLLYYLSRTREYLADEFAAKTTSAKALADALIKIAYGIVTAEDDDKTKRLLQSTRHLGITDVKNAKAVGVISYITNSDPDILAETMVFDKVNPWAKILELSSTHPLTGNRIDYLSDLSREHGEEFTYDIDAAIDRLKIDKKRLYNKFFRELFVTLLPVILPLLLIIFSVATSMPSYSLSGVFLLLVLGIIIQTMLKFPSFSGVRSTTVLEQMRDPYASPIIGKPVTFSGKVIGRGVPGYIFSEDMMYQDSTGLIFLNYTSFTGFIGNIFFALSKLKTLFEQSSTATGWFFRGISSSVSLANIKTEHETVKSYPRFLRLVIAIIILLLSVAGILKIKTFS